MSVQEVSDSGLGCWLDCVNHFWKEIETNGLIQAGLIDKTQANYLLNHPQKGKKNHVILFARKGPKANHFYTPNVTHVGVTQWFHNQIKQNGKNKGTIPATNKLACFSL